MCVHTTIFVEFRLAKFKNAKIVEMLIFGCLFPLALLGAGQFPFNI